MDQGLMLKDKPSNNKVHFKSSSNYHLLGMLFYAFSSRILFHIIRLKYAVCRVIS